MIYRCPISRRRRLEKRKRRLVMALAASACLAVVVHQDRIAAVAQSFSSSQEASSSTISAVKSTPRPTARPLHVSQPSVVEVVRAPLNVSASEVNRESLARAIVKKFRISPEQAYQVIEQAETQAGAHNLDMLLILSVIATESSFNSSAKSHAGALGLMQVIPRWHPEQVARLSIQDPEQELLEPGTNVAMGSLVLKKYLRMQKGNVARALQKYNGSLNDESLAYSNKVFQHYRWLFDKSQA